jgi:hypothetical protein
VHHTAGFVEQGHRRAQDVARQPAAELSGVLGNARAGHELPVAGRATDDGVVREGRGGGLDLPVLSRVAIAERPDAQLQGGPATQRPSPG